MILEPSDNYKKYLCGNFKMFTETFKIFKNYLDIF